FQTTQFLAGIALLLQGGDFLAQPLDSRRQLVQPRQRPFHFIQRGSRCSLLARQLLEAVGKRSGTALLVLQIARQALQLLPLLAQSLILVALLAREALLLGSERPLLLDQIESLLLQLPDAQLHRLALGRHVGLGGHHFSGDVLQPSGGIFADSREAILGGDQLHFQPRDLLVTPPTKPSQRDEQRNDQHPQRRRAA